MASSATQRRIAIVVAQSTLVLLIALLIALGVNAMVSRQLADSTWGSGPAAPESVDAAAPVRTATPGLETNVMRYNRNLFNQSAEPSSEPMAGAAGVGEDVELGGEGPEVLVGQTDGPGESDLQHQLVGTMVASEPSASVAHVKTSQGEDVYVRIGDTLPSCRVVRIGREFILVERTDRVGEIEYLSLYGKSGSAGQRRFADQASASRRQALGQTQKMNVRPTLPPKPAALTAGRGFIKPPAGMIRATDAAVQIDPELVQMQNKSGASLGDTMKLQPMMQGGDIAGMRIGRIEDGSVFAEIGLAEGDVIRSVNGEAATDDRVAGSFMQTLQSEGEVTVEVDRRGKVETLTLRAE